MRAFTLTDSLIVFAFLIAFLVVLAALAYRDSERKRKKAEDRWPSAKRKYSRTVNDKLGIDFDPTQDMYQ